MRRNIRLTVAAPPGSRTTRVEKIYIAVSDHDDGEGIYTIKGAGGERLPIAAIDTNGLGLLSEYSQKVANKTGRTVSIICFTARTHHETFRPSTTGDKEHG